MQIHVTVGMGITTKDERSAVRDFVSLWHRAPAEIVRESPTPPQFRWGAGRPVNAADLADLAKVVVALEGWADHVDATMGVSDEIRATLDAFRSTVLDPATEAVARAQAELDGALAIASLHGWRSTDIDGNVVDPRVTRT